VVGQIVGLPDPRALEDTGSFPGYDGNVEPRIWKVIDLLTDRFSCTLARLAAA
jgi:hypothetical protein